LGAISHIQLWCSLLKSAADKFVPNPVVAAFEIVKFPDAVTVTSLAKLSAVDNLMVAELKFCSTKLKSSAVLDVVIEGTATLEVVTFNVFTVVCKFPVSSDTEYTSRN
jgi:hypothetical protein